MTALDVAVDLVYNSKRNFCHGKVQSARKLGGCSTVGGPHLQCPSFPNISSKLIWYRDFSYLRFSWIWQLEGKHFGWYTAYHLDLWWYFQLDLFGQRTLSSEWYSTIIYWQKNCEMKTNHSSEDLKQITTLNVEGNLIWSPIYLSISVETIWHFTRLQMVYFLAQVTAFFNFTIVWGALYAKIIFQSGFYYIVLILGIYTEFPVNTYCVTLLEEIG